MSHEAISDAHDDTVARSGEEREGPDSKGTEQKIDKIARQRGQSRPSFASFVLTDHNNPINQATEEKERRYGNEKKDFETVESKRARCRLSGSHLS